MRKLIREAIEGARDEMTRFVEYAHADAELSEEEQLNRYVDRHRGQLRATLAFARRRAPPGADVLAEAERYEREMERRLQARGR